MNIFTYSIAFVLFLIILNGNGQQVCYNELGCFSIGSPWISSERAVYPPNPPNTVPADFRLFTRKNPKNPIKINIWPEMDMETTESHFNPDVMTMIYFHGWRRTPEAGDVTALKDAFLQRIDCNVIAVFWQEAETYSYLLAVSDIRIVAAKVARFLRALMEKYGYSPCKIHLIGFSIGAHIASYVAKQIDGICRLTALEPSSFFFDGPDASIRVNSTDAQFVEVVHTMGYPVLGAGINEPIGDVDYYINGGWTQPGCLPHSEIGNTTLRDLLNASSCYHFRSVLIYKEAVTNQNCRFWGKHRNSVTYFLSITSSGRTLLNKSTFFNDCDLETCIPMGLESIHYPARGSFDVITSSAPPFCINYPDVNARMSSELKKYTEIV